DLEVLPTADALSICSSVPNQCRSHRKTHRESNKETCVDFSARPSVFSLVAQLKRFLVRLLLFLYSQPLLVFNEDCGEQLTGRTSTPKALANSSPGLEQEATTLGISRPPCFQPCKGYCRTGLTLSAFVLLAVVTQGSRCARTLGWN